jgi:hypothetical protein
MGTAETAEQNYFALDTTGESNATRDWAKQQREKGSAPKDAAPADHKH